MKYRIYPENIYEVKLICLNDNVKKQKLTTPIRNTLRDTAHSQTVTMKKTKKIISLLLGGLSLTYAGIIIFPSFLFANNLKYKSFNVFYHSSEINVEKLKSVLDKSQNLLNNTELYEAGINQDIFICSSYTEFTFFALLRIGQLSLVSLAKT